VNIHARAFAVTLLTSVTALTGGLISSSDAVTPRSTQSAQRLELANLPMAVAGSAAATSKSAVARPVSATSARGSVDGPATNILANSSFAQGLQGWRVANGSSASANAARIGRSGTMGARLTSTSSRVELRNRGWNSAVQAQPGDRFSASFQVRASQRAAGTVTVVGAAKGRPQFRCSAPFSVTASWRTVPLSCEATRPSTNLRIRVEVRGLASGASVDVDNVTLKAVGTRTLLRAGFNKLRLGAISPGGFISQLGGTNKSAAAYDDTSVVRDSRGSGKVLRTTLDKGTVHSIPAGNNGIVVFPALRRTVTAACISYDLRFDSQFDWSLGGKLPGLLGVEPGVAPSVPTGGTNPGDRGWSGRMMWLGKGTYSITKPNVGLSYMYGPDQKSQYGDNIFWNRSFIRGRWHHIRECYAMNTVGKSNGRLEAWLDGHVVVNRKNYVYRTRSDVAINYLAWSVFRGGHTLDWAGDRTDTIDFDNVVVTSKE
jgi:hypothetical protein